MTTLRALFLAILLTSALAFAQGTYTQIDYPGARATFAWGISSIGDVVGSYQDTQYLTHGFVLQQGQFLTIDYPGAVLSTVTGRNSSGQTVGFYEPTPNGSFVGFFMDASGFVSVEYPGSPQTEMTGINERGLSVGYYDVGTNGTTESFKWLNGNFLPIHPQQGSSSEAAFGINNLGDFVVYIARTNAAENFILTTDKKYIPITFPGSEGVNAYALNDSGATVGIYESTVSLALLGFVLQDRNLTSLSFPNSVFTDATGINDLGEVVGTFRDTQGNYHAYSWIPSAPAEKTLNSTK
jgi:probable HAF family extracellular repeat protein